MVSKEEQTRIIEMLAKNEEIVASLYATFTNKFPEHQKFWNIMELEERTHADWIRRLSKIKDQHFFIKAERFDIQDMEKYQKFLEDTVTRFKEHAWTPKGALNACLDIENSLLESRYFEIFDGDVEGFKMLLGKLASATRNHVERVKQELGKIKY